MSATSRRNLSWTLAAALLIGCTPAPGDKAPQAAAPGSNTADIVKDDPAMAPPQPAEAGPEGMPQPKAPMMRANEVLGGMDGAGARAPEADARAEAAKAAESDRLLAVIDLDAKLREAQRRTSSKELVEAEASARPRAPGDLGMAAELARGLIEKRKQAAGGRGGVSVVLREDFPEEAHARFEAILLRTEQADILISAFRQDPNSEPKWSEARGAVVDAQTQAQELSRDYGSYPDLDLVIEDLTLKHTRLEAEKP